MIKHSANDMVSEQVDRLITKCAQEKNIVSEAALYELKLAVEASPKDFIADEEEKAFAQYVNVIGKYQAGITKEIDSDADFFASRMDLLNFLHNQMTNITENPALNSTSINLEAQRILAQISNNHPAAILNDLLDLQKEFDPIFRPKLEQAKQEQGDAWSCAEARPLLRLYAQIAQVATDCACFKLSKKACEDLLFFSPTDLLGARFTLAYVLARLEDEEGLHKLDESCGYQSNAWMRLAFTLLFFKLNRMPAAKRALKGFVNLGEGAAYALLRPSFVDLYIPCRINFTPDTFAENVIAVHEAEAIIADVPEFISWAESVPGVTQSARDYAFKAGLDWWENEE
ncbi:MAG: hypothetical protein HXK50_03380 [Atopobium sp.]|nr:hypothetical protein [Atopobium sp.]